MGTRESKSARWELGLFDRGEVGEGRGVPSSLYEIPRVLLDEMR